LRLTISELSSVAESSLVDPNIHEDTKHQRNNTQELVNNFSPQHLSPVLSPVSKSPENNKPISQQIFLSPTHTYNRANPGAYNTMTLNVTADQRIRQQSMDDINNRMHLENQHHRTYTVYNYMKQQEAKGNNI
jgi:hypothetical protein